MPPHIQCMNNGDKLQVMCDIVPLFLFNIFGLITNDISIFGEESTKSCLACIYTHKKKLSFGLEIFKIGALVSNYFNKLKFSSHSVVHSNLIPLF
jgi:hypothetical protein